MTSEELIKAGRLALLAEVDRLTAENARLVYFTIPKTVTAAIEDGTIHERARIRAAVEALPDIAHFYTGEFGFINRVAVLAAIAEVERAGAYTLVRLSEGGWAWKPTLPWIKLEDAP